MLAHSDETDDSHAPSQSHPGCSIVPAALAAGEQFGIDGTRFMRAVALGYDVGTRVTMTLGALDYQMETHRSTHSIAGDFGSAAAAGCVAGLESATDALDARLCGATSVGNRGVAARHGAHRKSPGVRRNAGAQRRHRCSAGPIGATGVDDILSGADNFLPAYAPKADPDGLIDKLGERYEITRTNIKKWTVGSPIQAPLDALETIRKKHPFEASQVQNGDGPRWPRAKRDGEQSRNAGHLHAVHDRRDAAG